MSDGIDQLALIGDATPAAKPKGPAGVPGSKYPDPWETPRGRATLDKWGVGDKAETKPAEGPADPWASPASPAADDPWNPKPRTGGGSPDPRPCRDRGAERRIVRMVFCWANADPTIPRWMARM